MRQSKDLHILYLMLSATRRKALRWTKTAPDCFEATTPDGVVSITFQYPQLADESISGSDIVQVSVFGLGLTFFNGTEGMEIVREILSAGLPEWTEWTTRMDQLKDRVTDKLRALDNRGESTMET